MAAAAAPEPAGASPAAASLAPALPPAARSQWPPRPRPPRGARPRPAAPRRGPPGRGAWAAAAAAARAAAAGAAGARPAYPAFDEAALRDLLGRMTLEEKMYQTCIDTECAESQAVWLRCHPMKAGASFSSDAALSASMSPAAGDRAFELRPNARLGIRGMRLRDGPKGLTCENFGAPCPVHGQAPAFPAQSLRAASWDVALEEEFGEAVGEIAERLDVHAALLPTINVLPWLHWGRGQESFGEDPVLNGKMGAAAVRGVQKTGRVMATAKHFLANNIENSRWWVSADMSDKMLHEVYLKAWAVLMAESAPELIMTGYNRVQGRYSFTDPKFIDLLRSKLGFQGSIMTDWMATWETLTSGAFTNSRGSPYYGQVGFIGPGSVLGAGVDMEMPYCSKNRDLVAMLQGCSFNGSAAACAADDSLHRAAGRLLRSKMRYGLVGTRPPRRERAVWDNGRYGELALRIAQRSIVLLRNEGGFLPKRPAEVTSIVVLGSARLLEDGDRGSSRVKPSIMPVTVLDGLRAKYGAAKVAWVDSDFHESWLAQIRQADMVIVDVGYDWTFEGEFIPPDLGGDRKYLTLHDRQLRMIKVAANASSNVVPVITSGQAVIVEDFVDDVPAALWLGYSGPLGGQALADILSGDVNPSGRTVSVTPRRAADYLPPGVTQEPWKDAPARTYPYAYGFKKMWADAIEPRFPLGFGLSYTSFAFGTPTLTVRGDLATEAGGGAVRVAVTNTGAVPGIETVQLYGTCEACRRERLPIVLLGFAKVRLAPGASADVEVAFAARDLAVYLPDEESWLLEGGRYAMLVGPCADAAQLQRVAFDVAGDVAFAYPAAVSDPDAFMGPRRGCEQYVCTPEFNESARIPAWALPSDKDWNFAMLLYIYVFNPLRDAQVVFAQLSPRSKFAAIAASLLAALGSLLWCCRCCWRCRRRCCPCCFSARAADSVKKCQ